MSADSPIETFLTVAEVAARLRVTQQTVRNWIDRRALPAVRVGRRVRVCQSDLDRYLERGATHPGNADFEEPGASDGPGHAPPQAAGIGARERFLGAAVDFAAALLAGRRAELVPALRALAHRAESWANELER